jgi:hypothetical protein
MIRSSALLALASSLLLLASVAQAFFVLPSASSAAACARTSQRVISAVRMQGAKDKEEKAADEQEIKDLTLEDMFDVSARRLCMLLLCYSISTKRRIRAPSPLS